MTASERLGLGVVLVLIATVIVIAGDVRGYSADWFAGFFGGMGGMLCLQHILPRWWR